MFKEVKVHAAFNDVTGYGIHATNFFPALEACVSKTSGGKGTVHISLLDVVTAAHTTESQMPPSILYNVWESTEYPAEFMKRLSLYDQLWVPSEWQRACSIAQGIPEEFVKVVPEGVNPDIYKPDMSGGNMVDKEICGSTFNFLLVGKWEPRKSNLEICRAFIEAFPINQYPDVKLYLSCDTLFNCDQYKSTEERLKGYGIEDPRFIVIHFEERAAYVRRLQAAHVFVSCSRAEGWGLPIIESMACGIPTIMADWSGPTEYAGKCSLKVRIRELRKPKGIYGDWDVPGKWGEPDYDHLVEVMKEAYDNYTTHKEKALENAEYIRTNFSWEKAAEKATVILEDLSQTVQRIKSEIITPAPEVTSPVERESEVRAFARSKGFEIGSLRERTAIFTVDCHPTNQDKLDTLIETIGQIKAQGYPILLASHVPLPPHVVEMVDYHIYDKKDVLSGDDRPWYWRRDEHGNEKRIQSSIPCHALAAVHNVRNACDFILGKYEWMYQMNSDVEVDLKEWLRRVHASNKSFICQKFEGQEKTVSGLITAGKTELMDKILLRIPTWEEFVKFYGNDRFNSEKGYYRLVEQHIGLENVEWIDDMDVGNRFNQIDRKAWNELHADSDRFIASFIEGPCLQIEGDSTHEYDVVYSTPDNANVYEAKGQKCGMWSRPSIKYFKDWTITAYLDGEVKFQHKMDLRGKRVIISMGSRALGDTLAWIPYVEEFRKKHGCHVICSGWWLDIVDYPEVEFVLPGTGYNNIYGTYEVGCFDNQPEKNVEDWRRTPLQKVAADILGLDYVPLRARLKHQRPKRGNGDEPLKPYVTYSEWSTMKNKLWNREGAWQNVIDCLVELGYECIAISSEQSYLKNVTLHTGQLITDTINDISGAEFHIGLNAGPSWIAYSLGVPCIMITGVSEEWNDAPNPYRVAVDVGCKPCFNNLEWPIQRGWEWCPGNKDYACTKEITEEMVIEKIKKIRGTKNASEVSKTKTAHGNCGASSFSGEGREQGRLEYVQGRSA